MSSIHPDETERDRILAERVDLSHHDPLNRSIIERMIHATADLSFAESARIGEQAAGALFHAIQSNATVIVDAPTISAGITRYPTNCNLRRVPPGSTQAAAAFELAAKEHPTGAVFVCGETPTALFELIRLHRVGLVEPAAVVGLPVGFVGAKESKAALWESSLQSVSITNVGERGGSSPAAGAINAIVGAAKLY